MKNKALTAAIAAVMAVSTLGVANAAEAQSRHDRGDRWEQRQDRGHDRGQNARNHQRNAQQQRQIQQRQRQIAQQQRQIQEQQRRLQQQQRAQARVIAQRRYNAGAYHRPYGYQYRQWNAGYTLPPAYRHSRYAVDHRRYGLRAPPAGYQYTRVDNDVVLTAIATGLIASVIVGLFN